MGFSFRKSFGTKNFKVNITKNGINSVSFKLGKGIRYNTKKGMTYNIPGTGISYNSKNKNSTISYPKQNVLIHLALLIFTAGIGNVIYFFIVKLQQHIYLTHCK